MQLQHFSMFDDIRKEQNIIINKRLTSLIILTLSVWLTFSTFVYIRPIFWQYYTTIHASPFTVLPPSNETIYAAPCLFEMTQPYYDNYTCNIRNIIYNSKLLTCPNGYYCDDLNNRKVCVLNDTYYCPEDSLSDSCLTSVSNEIGLVLFSNTVLKHNDTQYTVTVIMVSFYSIFQVLIFILLYTINWIMYYKQRAMLRFHSTWYIVITMIYYVNLVAVPCITYSLVPNVNAFKRCYDMNLIMLSYYGEEVSILLSVVLLGVGTAIYVAIFLTMSKYLDKDAENKRLLSKNSNGADTEGFFL